MLQTIQIYFTTDSLNGYWTSTIIKALGEQKISILFQYSIENEIWMFELFPHFFLGNISMTCSRNFQYLLLAKYVRWGDLKIHIKEEFVYFTCGKTIRRKDNKMHQIRRGIVRDWRCTNSFLVPASQRKCFKQILPTINVRITFSWEANKNFYANIKVTCFMLSDIWFDIFTPQLWKNLSFCFKFCLLVLK